MRPSASRCRDGPNRSAPRAEEGTALAIDLDVTGRRRLSWSRPTRQHVSQGSATGPRPNFRSRAKAKSVPAPALDEAAVLLTPPRPAAAHHREPAYSGCGRGIHFFSTFRDRRAADEISARGLPPGLALVRRLAGSPAASATAARMSPCSVRPMRNAPTRKNSASRSGRKLR